MAISLVGTAEGTAINGGDVTIDLSSLSLAENDVVVVAGGFGQQSVISADAGVSTSGYAELAELDVNLSGLIYLRGAFSWKRMGGSPDASVTCKGNADANSSVSYVVMAFRGVDTTTAIDATTTTATGPSGGSVNSPSITTVTDGAAVLSMGLTLTNDSTVTAPTSYGDKVDVPGTDTNGATAVGAWRLISPAGAENPGAWVTDNSLWVAATIALRPASAGSVEDGVLGTSGTANVGFISDTESVLAIACTATAEFISTATVPAPFSFSGSATALWVGSSIASSGSLSAPVLVTASFVGGLAGSGNAEMPGVGTADFIGGTINSVTFSFDGTVTAAFVSDPSLLSHVREVIESRGAATVDIG